MPSKVNLLSDKKLISPPKYVSESVQLEVIMGSVAYGVSSDTSDMDVYGFCIPPKTLVFPHLSGEIPGFGTQIQRFEQYQQHHIIEPDSKQEYDFSIYSIVKYFQLCMENNPNMIDSLFVPRRCVLYSTAIGEYVRDKRKIFLHKGAYHKFKGYAYSQLSKLNRIPDKSSTRYYDYVKNGFSTKYAYHLVRLLDEVQQILEEHDLDLTRNREQLKAIRNGEMSLERIKDYFELKEKHLEDLYHSSTLPVKPNEEMIKNLLLECLEMFYGSLDKAIKDNDSIAQTKLEQIRKILES